MKLLAAKYPDKLGKHAKHKTKLLLNPFYSIPVHLWFKQFHILQEEPEITDSMTTQATKMTTDDTNSNHDNMAMHNGNGMVDMALNEGGANICVTNHEKMN